MAFRLSVEDGSTARTLVVRAGALVVGRRPEGGLALASPGIADRHAVFRQSGDRVEVVDQRTRIGIRVGGERVERALLAQGDSVQIGATRITVTGIAAEAAAPAPPQPAAAAPLEFAPEPPAVAAPPREPQTSAAAVAAPPE